MIPAVRTHPFLLDEVSVDFTRGFLKRTTGSSVTGVTLVPLGWVHRLKCLFEP